MGIIDVLFEKYCLEGVFFYLLFLMIFNLLGLLIVVGIWYVENMFIFVIVMIFIVVIIILFGYRIIFVNI